MRTSLIFDTTLIGLADPTKASPCWCSHPRNASYLRNYKVSLSNNLHLLDFILIQPIQEMILEYVLSHPYCYESLSDSFEWKIYNIYNILPSDDTFDWDNICLRHDIGIICDNHQLEEAVIRYLLFRKRPEVCVVESSKHNFEDVLPACFHHTELTLDVNLLIRNRNMKVQAQIPNPKRDTCNDNKYFDRLFTVLIQGNLNNTNEHYLVDSAFHFYGQWICYNDWNKYKRAFLMQLDWLVISSQCSFFLERLYKSRLGRFICDGITLEEWKNYFRLGFQDQENEPLIIFDMKQYRIYQTILPKFIPPFRLDSGSMFKVAEAFQLKRTYKNTKSNNTKAAPTLVEEKIRNK